MTLEQLLIEEGRREYAKGILEGEARGEARGRAEGEARGRAEGEARGKLDIVKRFKSCGVDIAIIKEATGLSEAEIKGL